MHKHAYFKLVVHENQELAEHVGGEILERETLHEWPLSCVERVVTAQGQWIYKSQFGPTVEAEFYAVARSDLLGQVRTIYQADGHTCTLRDYVDAPLIEELEPDEVQAVAIARQVRRQMDAIQGDLPSMYDIRTPEQWLALADGTIEDMAVLVEQGTYTLTTPDMVDAIVRWAHSDAALEAVQRHPGYVHGDSSGDNLFVLPDGSYRVIDWQRPFYGPTEVDIASLIESLGFDPTNHVGSGIVQVRCFVLVHWITSCAIRWFPEGKQGYDRLTAEQVSKIQSMA